MPSKRNKPLLLIAPVILMLSVLSIYDATAQPEWLKPGAYFVYTVSSKGYVEGFPTTNGTLRIEITSISGGRAYIKYVTDHPLLQIIPENYVVDIKNREIIRPTELVGQHFGLWLPAGIKQGEVIEILGVMYEVKGTDVVNELDVWKLYYSGMVEGTRAEGFLFYTQVGASLLCVAETDKYVSVGELNALLIDTNIMLEEPMEKPPPIIPPIIEQYSIPIVVVVVAGVAFLVYRRKRVKPLPTPPVYPPTAPPPTVPTPRLSCPKCGAQLTGEEDFCTNCGYPLKGLRGE